MRRWLVPAFFVLLSATLAAAETEQLEADFLEYLAHLEGDDDDWTLVAEAEEAQSTTRKDADAETSKPADPPAVDER